jgi:hypothetical protein
MIKLLSNGKSIEEFRVSKMQNEQETVLLHFVAAWGKVSRIACARRLGVRDAYIVHITTRMELDQDEFISLKRLSVNLNLLCQPAIDRLVAQWRVNWNLTDLLSANANNASEIPQAVLHERFVIRGNSVSPKVHPDTRAYPFWVVESSDSIIDDELREETENHTNLQRSQNVLVAYNAAGDLVTWFHSGKCRWGTKCKNHALSTYDGLKKDVCAFFAELSGVPFVDYWSEAGSFFLEALQDWPQGAHWRLFVPDDGDAYYQIRHRQVEIGRKANGPKIPGSILWWNNRSFGDRLTCTEPILLFKHQDAVMLTLWSKLQVCRSCTNILGWHSAGKDNYPCVVNWEKKCIDAPIVFSDVKYPHQAHLCLKTII